MAAVLIIDAPARRSLYLPLLIAATLLAFCVVGLGAYVRLSDAGLGCPDWPGCYGHLVGVPDTPAENVAAASAFPGNPVVAHKAWKEMIHRYAAGSLGLLILGIAITAWKRRIERHPWLETFLVGLVAFQALLGMWTVTLLLKPVVVTAHLLGGMATWAMLAALTWRQLGSCPPLSGKMRLFGGFALLLLFMQIALGGWVSSNYAALACIDFPTCQGEWWPGTDFQHAFQLRRELGQTAAGDLLPMAALTAIHWSHRIGALMVLFGVGGYAFALFRLRHGFGTVIAVLLALQIGLGILNVLLSLPILLAVAHNLCAAMLLAAVVLTLIPSVPEEKVDG